MTPAPKKAPAKAEKPKKPVEKSEAEGPGDDDSMPDFAVYPGVVPADQGDQGRL